MGTFKIESQHACRVLPASHDDRLQGQREGSFHAPDSSIGAPFRDKSASKRAPVFESTPHRHGPRFLTDSIFSRQFWDYSSEHLRTPQNGKGQRQGCGRTVQTSSTAIRPANQHKGKFTVNVNMIRLSQQSAHSRHFFAPPQMSAVAFGGDTSITGIARLQSTAQVNMDRVFDADLMFNTGMTGRPRNRGLQPHAGSRKRSDVNLFDGARLWPLYIAGALVAGIAVFMLISALLS